MFLFFLCLWLNSPTSMLNISHFPTHSTKNNQDEIWILTSSKWQSSIWMWILSPSVRRLLVPLKNCLYPFLSGVLPWTYCDNLKSSLPDKKNLIKTIPRIKLLWSSEIILATSTLINLFIFIHLKLSLQVSASYPYTLKHSQKLETLYRGVKIYKLNLECVQTKLLIKKRNSVAI